jgi:5'-AMP-activated protein kinase, catalytic alpha subunit
LLLDENLNIRLIDFGLANIMRDSLALKTACGSPNYAAPEVISGMSYGGAEVDIWSCGVILYAMVCGSLPFDDDQMPQLFSKIKECRYFIPNNISHEVKDLINLMLQPNPVKRITLQEIQEHVWYQQNLPDYLHFISKQQMNNKNAQIDTQIAQELFTLNLNITKTFDEVCQDILNKRNTDYCGAYELMKHDKLKSECFKISAITGKAHDEDKNDKKK